MCEFFRFVDDIPITEGELFAGFVLSECAHGTFTIDTTALDTIKVNTVYLEYCLDTYILNRCKCL